MDTRGAKREQFLLSLVGVDLSGHRVPAPQRSLFYFFTRQRSAVFAARARSNASCRRPGSAPMTTAPNADAGNGGQTERQAGSLAGLEAAGSVPGR